MATKRIPLGEWLPDQPSVVGTIQDIDSLVPVANGYVPFPTAVDYSNGGVGSLTNVFAGKFSGLTQLFAGDQDKLYKFNATTLNLDNVSKSGNYSGSDRWFFAQYGNSILAVNNTNKIQSWTMGTSSLFADVNASAPVAKYITIVRDFVVAANLDNGTNANKVQWSDINDETNWTSGAASQSDYQIVADGGDITGITGGEFGIILLEKAIVRMSYIGSPLFFQFDTLSRNLGCMVGGSVAQFSGITYFLSDDGFYACDGKSITPIGNEKVDRFFFDDLNGSLIDTMSAASDPTRKLILWNYPNVAGGRTLLMYNWQIQKWSKATTDVDYITYAATSGVTLEDLDAYGTIDSLTTSLDDRLWVGGQFFFAGTRGDNIVTFTGANATANVVVGDTEFGYNSVINLVRSQVQDGSFDVEVSSRRQLQDTVTFGSSVSASSEGRASVRSAGRYHRFSLTPTGVWTNILSMDVDYTDQGTR